MKRTLLALLGCALLLAAAAYYNTPKAKGGGAPEPKAEHVTDLSPQAILGDSAGPQPELQPVALNAPTRTTEAEQFSADNVRKAKAALARVMELDGIRDISRPSTVIVGQSFSAVEFETKRMMLVQVMVVRHSRGLSTNFVLREPINNREVGYFQDGYLEIK